LLSEVDKREGLTDSIVECPETDPDLASQATFRRIENGVMGMDMKPLHILLVEHYLKRRAEAPNRSCWMWMRRMIQRMGSSSKYIFLCITGVTSLYRL